MYSGASVFNRISGLQGNTVQNNGTWNRSYSSCCGDEGWIDALQLDKVGGWSPRNNLGVPLLGGPAAALILTLHSLRKVYCLPMDRHSLHSAPHWSLKTAHRGQVKYLIFFPEVDREAERVI